MAEAQRNVELPKETTEVPAPITTTATEATTTAPVEETKPVEETAPATETAPITEDKTVEETKAAETAEEAPKAEEKKEVTPVEEGQLGHKAQGLSFPKNLIATKEFFFFGTDAVEPKSLAAYQRTEKSTDVAQSNVAWASQTGKGLLFIGDKKFPTGIINLSDAKDPEVDGANKFTLTSKGNKHTFKAANTSERDNWVSQLKLKIAEAKELSPTVTESETYKATLESFKPAKKEEKPVAAAATTEEAAKTEDTPAVTEEAPKEDAVAAAVAPETEEAATKDAVKEEPKVEEPKRRSASRKRASFFGFGGKKSPKAEESKKLEEPTPVEPLAAEAAPATTEPVAATETEAPKTEETPATAEVVPATTEAAPAAATEDKAVEEVKTPPATTKRNSFFGGVFGKKDKKVAETKPSEDVKPAEATEEPIVAKDEDKSTDAPVIPPVETSTPLAVEVNNPGTVPVETVDVTPAAATTAPTVEEPKKDVKEKRKSSLPFAFGKRDKSPTPASDGESPKAAKASPFSKFRATIKGNKSSSSVPKTEDKTEEVAKEETAVESKPEDAVVVPAAETSTETAPAPVAATEETPKLTETENKPESVPTTTPAVTAAA